MILQPYVGRATINMLALLDNQVKKLGHDFMDDTPVYRCGACLENRVNSVRDRAGNEPWDADDPLVSLVAMVIWVIFSANRCELGQVK